MLSVAAWVSAIAGAGSGTALITPSAPVAAGSSGKWSIQYTAAEAIKNGRVRVTVPAGFTAPQSSSTSSAGYASVSTNEPTGTPSLSVGGQNITIDVDTLTAGNTITVVYGDDSGSVNGRASAATTLGSYTFIVASDPSGTSVSPIAASPSLTVIADTPDHIEIAPSDTTVVAGTFPNYRLIVRDQYGNRAPVSSTRTLNLVASSGQFFTTGNHSTPITTINIASGKTSVTLDYKATLASPSGSPHSLAVFTTTGSPSLGGTDDVNVTAAALSIAQSTVSATSPVVADGANFSSVTVTSKDAFGNPRGGDTVAINSTGSGVETQPVGNTDANGEASGAVSNTVAQAVTVSATINGQLINNTAPITFIAGPVDAATSTVSATSPVVANGTSTSTITVTAKDLNGNPVAGQNVTLSVLPSANATLTQPGGVTNASGVVTGTLSSTTVGNRTVSAQIGATLITDDAVVSFTNGTIASFVWTVDGAATAGVAESVTLTAKDAQGHTVTNFTGAVSLNTTSGGVGDAVVQWAAGSGLGSMVNGSGDAATYTFVAGDNGSVNLSITDTRAETITLSAVSGGANGTSSNLVVSSAAADVVQLIAGNNQTATVGAAVATAPNVKVVDPYGNAVAGAVVTFAVTGGGGTRDVTSGGGVDATGITAADGTIDCDVWTLGTTAGSNNNTLQASIAAGTTPSVTFTASATAGAGANLVITPASQNVTVNSSTLLTATLTDAFGNARSGDRIDIFIKDSADGSLANDPSNPTSSINATARFGNADANGKIFVNYVAPAGSGLADIIDASTSTVGAGSVADRTYTTTASGGTSYRITFVGPASAVAGASFHFKVEAVDGGGNIDTSNNSTATLTPETGSGPLQFSLTDFGAQTTSIPLVNGTRDVYGRGTVAGNWDITASGSLGSDLKAVDITPAALDHYDIANLNPVAAGTSFNVSVTARDQYNNQVTGANNAITLAAWDDVNNNAALSTLSNPGANLSGGQATVSETYTKAESIRIRVSDSNSKLGTSNAFAVSDAGAYRIAKVSGDSSSIVAGNGQALVVQVLDPYDNPVPGATVNFARLLGTGSIPASAVTNASGNAQQTLTTGTVVGSNTAKATILDESPAALERVDFSVSTIAGAIANYLVTASKTNPVAHEDVTITVTGRDANNNPRTQDSSTNITLSKTGSAVLAASSGTLSNGMFTTTVHDDVAESFTVSAQTTGTPSQNGTSPTITATNAPAYQVFKVSGDASGLTAGGTQPLTVVVKDIYGNTVANQVVTFAIASAPDGTASLTDGTGDPSDGITITNGSGQATVTYTTALTAGTNTINAVILDGTPLAQERVTFTVTTAAGGIASYRVEMNATSTTAGVSKNVTVTALDANQNEVDDDVTQVNLSGNPGIGLVFGANPITLTNGVATTTVTATAVQTYNVKANTVGLPLVTGTGPAVTVVPAPPSGTITATATQNTITANGTSTTTITSGVIRDTYGNQVVSGLNVTVTAGLSGSIVGGSPKQIDGTGRISFDLRSSTTTGTSTVDMTSTTGSATGSINITFAPKPLLTCNNIPSPSIVVPGQNVAFSVQADNASTTAVNLTTATTFTFSDGSGHSYSANLAAPQSIPGSGSATLVFSSAPVNAAFTTTQYQPIATLIGMDQFNSAVNATCPLPGASLLVTSIEITAIVPMSGTVSAGQQTTIAVTVKNNGAQNATINDVDLSFIPNDAFAVGNALENGSVLSGGASKVFNVPVTVGAGATTGTYQVDAVATGTVGGSPVTDNSVAPHPLASLTVTAPANLTYEAGTLTPTTVSRGATYSFQLTLRNNGGGLVSLTTATTRFTFTDGTRVYSAAPSQAYAIPGGGSTQTVVFTALQVPAAFTPGSWAAALDAHGTDNGASFTQLIPLTGSNVLVQAPAAVSEIASDALKPDTVSKTTTATFTVQLQNTGGATVVLNPATTTIKFASNQYSAALNPSGPTTLAPGTTTLQFLGAVVSNAIAMQSYNPVVQLTGSENGNAFSQAITLADNVAVQNAPAIAILSMTPSQSQFTTDQAGTIQVHMVVKNSSAGAGANFSSATLRFIHAGQDRTNQFTVSTPSSFTNGALLTAGETDEVVFDVSDNTGNLMTPGNMTIDGTVIVTDVNTSQPITVNTAPGSGSGNLMVMTPAKITFDAVLLSQAKVTAGMSGANRTWKVRAIARNSGGSDVVLTLTDLVTKLNFSPSPGWEATVQPALGHGGTTLSGGEIDTLIFDVTTTGSTPGPTNVDVMTSGVESNSGAPVPGTASGQATVQVQTPGVIQVTSVVPSRSSISTGTTLPWTVTVTLTNTGQSDVDLSLGGAVSFSIAGATPQPSFTIPATLAGGGVTLSGGETDQFVVSLTTAGTYASMGSKNISVGVNGTELNSGTTRSGNSSAASVTVEKVPDLAFASLSPGTVSKLATVTFHVDVQNTITPNGATATLDRSLTRLRFGSSQFNVGLDATSNVDVTSGNTTSLTFAGAVVGSGIPNGVQSDAQLELHWTQNGVAGTRTINLPTQITVQAAPALSILSVRPSKATMTRLQDNAGTVTMVLRNSGGAAVNLNLSPANTHLGFKVVSSGATVTNEYTITAPTALQAAGGTLLAGGATDSLVFDVAKAGQTTGAIILNGYVGGIDQNSLLPVTDDTFDGGSGGLTLQLPGALSILSITPAQATATAGQTNKAYAIKMAVKNIGGAAVDISLLLANSSLSFPGTTGWGVNAPTMANGVTLSGGETDTLSFLVTTTGGPAGVETINGSVLGTETNTGIGRSANTASGGFGTITLQTPANLIVDSVTPSQTSITQSTSAAWTTTIALHNAGQSTARLALPAGFSLSIANNTGGTTYVKPVDLEEGGVLLAGGASGTLVATTTATGAFSSTGNKALTVSIGATEVNSNRVFAAPGSGTVLVQSAPNLVVVAVRPTPVTSGSVIDFEVDVQNPGASSAAVKFDRGTTRARFASNAFSAVLDVASPDVIAGGAQVTLKFESKIIPTSIAIGPYNFNVDLNYTANGVVVSEPEVVTNGVTVQPAPQLFIQSIVTSQATVTAGQTTDWTATMTVVNNGAADIDINVNPALPLKTFLTFLKPNGQPDLTYTVNPPVMVGGDEILSQNETGQIQFTINQTGTTTGNITISGKVEGTDLNDASTVTDDTFDGGRGSVTVQTPATVSILAIHPTQPVVTVTQGSFGARLIVANTGGSDVSINLVGTNASFNPVGSWGTGSTSTLLGAGGNVLAGGAVDSLFIPLTATNSSGVTRINATMPWTQINSSDPGSSNTNTSGFGSIRTESKADLRVLATVSASPNPLAVNVNQAFIIQVTVQNQGGADATNVVMDMVTDGASAIQKPFTPIPVVPGGQSVAYQLPVIASSATNAAEKFTASVTSAIDENSGQSSLVNYTAAVDNNATVAVQTPATTSILYAHPSQPTVTRSQSTPWNVTVAVRNTGQAGVNLTPPAAGDLDFSILGATKLDYIVQAPTKFASGATGWTLAGGATDSLKYNVTTTGADTGRVDIDLAVAGTDRNDPTQNLTDTDVAHVKVQDVAGLFIASTTPVGTFNHASADRDTVNTNFGYEIHVSVQNAGGEDVDSVRVQLNTNLGANGSTIDGSLKRQSIAAGASREFVFRITSRANTVALETFTSSILSGVKSHNTGQTVIPQAPLDNAHVVVTQNRANLSLNLFVASPPGSVGGMVGANQNFVLGAIVSNPANSANLGGPAFVTLAAPGGFNVVQPLQQAFAENDTVRWNVTAPSAAQPAVNFSCAITTTPNDINAGAPAFVSKASDTQSITVTSGAALAIPDISVVAPAGATDDTLSVQQSFTVRVGVTVHGVKNLVSTLSIPGSFNVSGSPVFNFSNAAGLRTHDYILTAPALTSPTNDLFVTFTALDSITGLPVPSAADTVRVTTVARPSLSLSASVTAPPDAVDRKVGISAGFTVTAMVANAAGAADIAAPGNLTINLPPGYARKAGEAQVKPFVIGQAISWDLIAAAQPSGPDQIAITISTVPVDENSGLAAQVANGTANIPMITEGSAVAVSDVSSAQNVGTPVAPGGATNLDVLRFRVAYNVTDTNLPPAEVDTVAITILDKNGAAMSAGAVAQTLQRVALDVGTPQPFEVTNPTTNPVVISLMSGAPSKGFQVNPNASIEATVYLDLDPSPKATELRVNITGAGLNVKDPNTRLGVTNAQGQPLDMKSGPLVILSSNFQEYAHNYPNPFSAGASTTKIAYFLETPASVSLKIYAMTGDLVHEETIPAGDPRAQAGPQETTWDGRNDKGEVVRNGVYVCMLNAGGKSAKIRIAVAK